MTTGLVVLANVIADAFDGYPVTESVHAIEHWTTTVNGTAVGYTFIGDYNCPKHMMYGLPRSHLVRLL